ncbi:MAG: 3-dehydroquinate synthase [Alphaproteobacteria bacterium]
MPEILHRLHVPLLDRSYPLIIGRGLVGEPLSCLNIHPRRCVVVTDETVAPLYGATLASALPQSPVFVLPAGEGSKSWEQLEALTAFCLDHHLDRDTLMVALGGGVVGDLAGFAASILLRGLPIVHIPTTLLSQVDSAIGGKTAINTPQGKNLVGTFYQPSGVIMDIDVLATLPADQMLAGYGEILKYALLGNADFFDFLQEHHRGLLDKDPSIVAKALLVSAQMKADIVGKDEKEQGQRALLNLGHTFGHAIEHVSGFSILHGHAVLMGLSLAADLSHRLGGLPEDQKNRIQRHILDLPLAIPMERFAVSALMQAMQVDKKKKDDVLTFVLLRGIGEAFIHKQPVPAAIIQDVWRAGGAV